MLFNANQSTKSVLDQRSHLIMKGHGVIAPSTGRLKGIVPDSMLPFPVSRFNIYHSMQVRTLPILYFPALVSYTKFLFQLVI